MIWDNPLFSCCHADPPLFYAAVLFAGPGPAYRKFATGGIGKCRALYQQGKLDSVQIDAIYYENGCPVTDSGRWFYICTDTFCFEGGIYSIGKRIIDPFFDFNFAQTGEWLSYYPDGRLFSRGSYGVGYYPVCQGGGPGIQSYSFRQHEWTFWYPDGRVLANGRYAIVPQQMQAPRLPVVNVSMVTDDWQLFDEAGNRSQPTPALARRLCTDYLWDRSGY